LRPSDLCGFEKGPKIHGRFEWRSFGCFLGANSCPG
jgi:hypothetical protein